MNVQTGTITASGAKAIVMLGTSFSISIQGFGVATVELQRRLDGTNWGTLEAFTTDIEKIGTGPSGAEYRLNCTAYTSGTITYTLARH